MSRKVLYSIHLTSSTDFNVLKEEEEEEDEKKRQTMLWHILGLIIRIQQMYGHRTAYVYIVFY